MKNSNNYQVPFNNDNSPLIKRKQPFVSRGRQVMSTKVMSKVWGNYPNGGSGLLTLLAFADRSDEEIRALVVKLKTARKNAALGECHDNT